MNTWIMPLWKDLWQLSAINDFRSPNIFNTLFRTCEISLIFSKFFQICCHLSGLLSPCFWILVFTWALGCRKSLHISRHHDDDRICNTAYHMTSSENCSALEFGMSNKCCRETPLTCLRFLGRGWECLWTYRWSRPLPDKHSFFSQKQNFK